MNMKRALLILGATLIASAPVQAALTVTTYTSEAAWKAAVSGEQTENFDLETTGAFTYRVFDGFTIESDSLETMISAPGDPWIYNGTLPDVNGTNFLTYVSSAYTQRMIITLDEPTQALGFEWNNTDPSGDVVQMVLIVDGQSFNFGPPGSGFFGITVADGGFGSVLISDTPGDGGAVTGLGIDNFAFVDADAALFKVTKTVTPASALPVDVTLTCDTGTPLTQDATIIAGDPEGVTFVVENGVGADCTVTESGSNGYTTTMNGGAGCTFNNISNFKYECAIHNEADDVEFGFTKKWEQDGTGGISLERFSELEIRCDTRIDSWAPSGETGNGYNVAGGYYYVAWLSSSTVSSRYYSVDTDATGATPHCWVWEDAQDSAVEVTTRGACNANIAIGSSARSCVVTNTVFFEGIPTLSQYGLAIMALLMLGVGFVGFRRFV